MFGRLTREFFGPAWRERPSGEAEAWTPAIECQIANGNLVVKADLPDIDPKDVTISAVGHLLDNFRHLEEIPLPGGRILQ